MNPSFQPWPRYPDNLRGPVSIAKAQEVLRWSPTTLTKALRSVARFYERIMLENEKHKNEIEYLGSLYLGSLSWTILGHFLINWYCTLCVWESVFRDGGDCDSYPDNNTVITYHQRRIAAKFSCEHIFGVFFDNSIMQVASCFASAGDGIFLIQYLSVQYLSLKLRWCHETSMTCCSWGIPIARSKPWWVKMALALLNGHVHVLLNKGKLSCMMNWMMKTRTTSS